MLWRRVSETKKLQAEEIDRERVRIEKENARGRRSTKH